MIEEPPELKAAISLMRMALALLDKAGASTAAARLQHAIDTATGEPAIRPGDEIDPATFARHFPDQCKP